MSDQHDVLVLRKGTHGIPVEQYADALRSRLPDREVTLARTPAAEREKIEDARIVTGMVLDDDVLDHAESMEVFACAYAGVGHLPLDRLRERGVTVTNASGVHGPNMGEHVVGNVLSFTRRFHEGFRRQRRNEWRHYQTHELHDSTVTVVGLGAIGQAVVERLQGFGVDTIGVRHTPEKGGPTDEVIGFDEDDLHDALGRTDYLVLSCPLTDETRGLIGHDEFVTLPTDSVLINVARGPVVDTDDLLTALQSNWIRGAALDVTDPEPLPADHPLWNLGNVQITPHNAGYTPNYYERLADIVAGNVRQIDETGEYDDLENEVSL
ncbi:D-2-hydroxyacid dehydrogenase [Natronoarchaeum philippinense]|nr:D-2-hydroxyacid dehydrogenase [Natronoarchaeum philippinense]